MCACLEFVAHLVLAVVCDALLLRTGHLAVLEAARLELGGGGGVVAGVGGGVLLALEQVGHGGGPRGGALLGRALQFLQALLALLGVGARLLLELGEPARVLRRDHLQLLLALALDRVDLCPVAE